MTSMALTNSLMYPLAPALFYNPNYNNNNNNKTVVFSSSSPSTTNTIKSNLCLLPSRFYKPNATASSDEQQQQDDHDEDDNFQVLTAIRSQYNDIVIVDTPKSRMLLLDNTHNVHSILNKGLQKWTGSYWDEFASLPPLIPNGPIAIYGLGGGTAAHLLLDLWPSLHLEGWEIDELLIDKAREYFGLSDLEKHTQAGGILDVRIGDVFSPSETVSGGYAGIIIDLFSEGKVLSQLQEIETWLELKDRLIPNGRFMVNCGGIDGESDGTYETIWPKSMEGTWARAQNSTINALSEAFPGQVSWKRMPERSGENFLAVTGPMPDLSLWSVSVPGQLSESVKKWKPCSPSA